MSARHAVASMLTAVLVGASLSAATSDVRLVDAARKKDKAAVSALVRQRVNVNTTDVEGMTALHWAAHWNDLETVKVLLKAGATPKAANRYGVTPLHEASTVGNLAIIEALLVAGADPNAPLGEGETPLMTAARTGNTPAVKMLIAHGAQVNARESWRGQTALMWAAVENHADVAGLLVESGADVNARTVTYEFPNLTGGNGGIIHDRPQGGLTSLMFAARQGAIETAEVLLEAGADINAAEPQYGFTAMQTAVFNGHYDLAAFLMEKGADVNDGSLYIAVEMRNLATYSNRPNPPEVDRHLTSLDVITQLLNRGADPNRPYTKTIPPRQAQGNINVTPGATPLFRAIRSTDLVVVRLLMDNGANPSVKTKDGSTPLMVASGLGARRGGDEEVTEAEGRADPLDAIKLFLNAGADVNSANALGNTALHYAAQTGANRIVEFLAASGAKLDAKNKDGKTPLDVAMAPGPRQMYDNDAGAQKSTVALIRKLLEKSSVPTVQ
ncbi:MAG TPA: ankyrin repeat domain-containing protein [Vicinamibacterales bacterium]|jgi:ankyrin repeat protein